MQRPATYYRVEGWYRTGDRWVFLGAHNGFEAAEAVATNPRVNAIERRVLLRRDGTDLHIELVVWQRDELVMHKQ